MPVSVRNLSRLRSIPKFGQYLYEALSDLANAHNQAEQQTNSNLSGQTQAPPRLNGINVAAQDGIYHISLQHNGSFYRGVNYHVEYATDPNFTNPFPIDLHSAREHRAYLGNQTLYFRAAASYGISGPSSWIYYGGAQPTAVTGGGTATGPVLPTQSQGSGTGLPGQGLQGPGTLQFRGPTPPIRRAS